MGGVDKHAFSHAGKLRDARQRPPQRRMAARSIVQGSRGCRFLRRGNLSSASRLKLTPGFGFSQFAAPSAEASCLPIVRACIPTPPDGCARSTKFTAMNVPAYALGDNDFIRPQDCSCRGWFVLSLPVAGFSWFSAKPAPNRPLGKSALE
jgi:hypothetical protein